ncbi:MAG TPA: BatD family protein, partial [Thermoanaerobaculia bacterium]|nr:BatD family protein [Thermoanaerobaculia bacterium]
MRARAAVAALLLALAGAGPASAEVEVRARLEDREVAAGGTARLVVEVEGGVFDRLRPRAAFDVDNLTVLAGPDWIDNVQWVNGVTRRTLSLVWLLRAGEPGIATVHSLVVEVEGERYELPALDLRVVDGVDADGRTPGQRRALPRWQLPDPLSDLLRRRWPAPQREPPEIHLVADVAPARVWEGEQVLYTLWLYTQTNIENVSADALPDFRGFWVEEVPPPEQRTTERVEWNGEVYWRTALLERVLFPLRPGRHVIEPAAVEALAAPDLDPWTARGFDGSPGPRELVGDRLIVDVLPLPPPPPGMSGAFGGLVGSFDLETKLAPTSVAAGQAATLEVTLSGRGNLESIDQPPLPAIDGVERLPPAEEGGNRVTARGVEAERVWRFPLIAERPGRWRLPPIEIAYFDPRAGEYRLAASAPLTLAVAPAAPADAGGERHPIRNAALPADSGLSRWPRLLPWAFALPWLLALAVGLAGRGRAAAATEARQGESDPLRRFEERLAAAAGEERPRHTARAIEEAWRELLAETAGVPREKPPAAWAARLPAAARADGGADELARLADDLHYLRFA